MTNPLHRTGALAVAVSLHQRSLENDWCKRVFAADEVTKKRLGHLPTLSPIEQSVQRQMLADAWKQLYNEAQEKTKQHPTA